MIYLIPDTQSRPDVKNPLLVMAHHICELKPKFVIHLGDHWDFPSLSSYDKGKKSHQAKTYGSDVEAGNLAMTQFWAIIEALWPEYKTHCTWIILNGNHEYRRDRALEYGDATLVDFMERMPPDYTNWDTVAPFLQVVNVAGINFCHYFQNDGKATPIGTARQLCMKRHVSCIAGHKQGFDYEEMITGDGRTIQCMIAGSAYYHDEAYKTHTNHHFRGSVVLYNLNGEGEYDFARYSLKFLDGQYRST